MDRRGAASGERQDQGESDALQREEEPPEHHCQELIAIVDRFDPPPDVRAKEMVRHAFGLAGLRGWHKHAVAAAGRVAVEREEQRSALPDGWAIVRTSGGVGLTADELRDMGVFWTPPRPKRGRKTKES
jgi:hypothetical protein